MVGSVLLDCRNSTWNDTENDGWNDKHHHRGPMPETLNMDVRMNHADRVRLLQDEEEQERELQEKRWWLEEAQRRLTEEKEKLARDRQQLEVKHRNPNLVHAARAKNVASFAGSQGRIDERNHFFKGISNRTVPFHGFSGMINKILCPP